jgi:hypothetical protein
LDELDESDEPEPEEPEEPEPEAPDELDELESSAAKAGTWIATPSSAIAATIFSILHFINRISFADFTPSSCTRISPETRATCRACRKRHN